MKKRLTLLAWMCLSVAVAETVFAQPVSPPPPSKGWTGLFSRANAEGLLEPDQAFQFTGTHVDANSVKADLIPAKGYHLYRDKIGFALKSATGIAINGANLPKDDMRVDQIFSRKHVYRSPVPVEITLLRAADAKRLTLVASYQGCHENAAVWYPPTDKEISLTLRQLRWVLDSHQTHCGIQGVRATRRSVRIKK